MSFKSTIPRQTPIQNTSRRNLLKGGLAAFVGGPLLVNATAASESVKGSPVQVGAVKPLKPEIASSVSPPADMDRLFRSIKQEASDEELYKFLYAMPKGGDIHHHLGGGMLPYMWYEVGSDPIRNGGQRFYTRYKITDFRRHPLLSRPGVSHVFHWITLREDNYKKLDADFRKDFKPLDALDEVERAAWMSSVVLDEAGEGRDEFFEYHWTRLGDLMSSIHVMSELLVDNMKLFGAEGTTYLEIQRSAFGYRDERGQLLSPEACDAFWAERLAQPDALATGVTVRWQGVVLRFAPDAEDWVRKYFAHMDAYREHWVGINMAGREDNNKGYPSRFTEVYDEMLRKYPGIGISIHAGEAEKPDTYIKDTLRLGATRIGHGINLLSDSDTLLRMRDSNFLVEINLISNQLLGYVPDLNLHPFPVYLRQGIPCCLNTDDRGMWDSNFTDEVFAAVKRFNLSWDELLRIGRMSYEHSFAEPSLKKQLLDGYAASMDAFASQFTAENWKGIVRAVPAITHGFGVKDFGLSL